MANEIKKVNVDGITYDLGGGGGAGQELISQDDITFNEVLSDDYCTIEIADDEISNKYVNIVLDEVLSDDAYGIENIEFTFKHPKNATVSFIGNGNYINKLCFKFKTLLKGTSFSLYSQPEFDNYTNYYDNFISDNNYNRFMFLEPNMFIITLKFDAFGFLTIQHEAQGEM